MNFFNSKENFFNKFKLSPFLLWSGFCYFEDLFFLERKDFLSLYYSFPVETFSMALRGANKFKKLIFSLLDDEGEKENLINAMEKSCNPEDIYKARREIEEALISGLFFHKEFRFSEKLEARKARQIVSLIFYIKKILSMPVDKEKRDFIKKIPFWILAKILDILPYKEALKFMDIIEKEVLASYESEEIEISFVKDSNREGNIEKEILEMPWKPLFLNSFSLYISRSFYSSISQGRLLLASEEYKDSLKYLSRACSLLPDDLLANWSYARTLYFSGKSEEALKYYEKVIKEKPFLKRYHFFKALSFKTGGQMSLAAEELLMLTELSPDYPHGFTLLGSIYMVNRDFPEAIKCYERSLELLKDDTGVYVELAGCYFEKGEHERAKEYLSLALSSASEVLQKSKIYFRLAEISKSEKDNERALEFYKKSLDCSSDYLPSLNGLALLELDLGNREEAKKFLKRALVSESEQA